MSSSCQNKSVASKNTRSEINQAANSTPKPKVKQRTSTKDKALKERSVEQKVIQNQAELKRYDFKNKKTGKISFIEAIPLGSRGVETELNPNNLSPKDLLTKKYDERAGCSFSTVYGCFYTPNVPSSLNNTPLSEQVFLIKKGYDIAVSRTYKNEDGTISASPFLPYAKLAPKLDAIVDRMVENPSIDNTYNQELVRHRVGMDIIHTGSGAEIKGHYTEEEWHDLAEFAMIIRADKARAPGSTRYYIDPNIKDFSTSFTKRFGNRAESLYIGAPKGGAKKLKEQQAEYEDCSDADSTDTRSDPPLKIASPKLKLSFQKNKD